MLTLGPIALPYSLLILIAAILLGEFAAKKWLRLRGYETAPPTAALVFIGLLVARLSFVWAHADDYLPATWAILDIRDGGWHVLSGFAGAWIAGVWLMLRHPAKKGAYIGGLAVASITWLMGQGITDTLHDTPSLPDVELPTLDQQTVNLHSFTGQPLVINLWAGWCPPCRREMPVFERLQAERPDVHFVLINQGESPATVTAFLAQHQLALDNILLDATAKMGVAIGQRALPATLFFDAQGRWVATRMGELSRATLNDHLRRISPPAVSQIQPQAHRPHQAP